MDTTPELNDEYGASVGLYPWCEKYRPTKADDILSHDKILNAFNNYLNDGKFPHVIMAGSSGTGKTTTIIAFAKQYYGENFDNMTLILNASEERGIETVRMCVKPFVTTQGNNELNTFKLVIMDEMDSMTAGAQSMLRKIIETYTQNVRFCFICNYLKKINPAIQSRCVIFKFKPISKSIMYDYSIKICKMEKMAISENALKFVIKHADGDMRKMLNALQSLNMAKNSLLMHTTENVFDSEKLDNMDNSQQIITKKHVICEKHASKILSTPTQKMMANLLEYIQTHNLRDTTNYIYTLFASAEITLLELINSLYEICMDYIINDKRDILKYNFDKVVGIIKKLAIIDTNLSNCNDENLQIMSFTAMFFVE